ncbi:hypothetical protein [Rhizobium sp.]|jgi:hypothetical protein|uniref:hypothetical protein n=1 Tax=Rhizobium sp. TaxID=391 RepID=UPI000E8E429E|nr:hypothetical protein [Rhizobium sp.]
MNDIGHVFSAHTIARVAFGGFSSADIDNGEDDAVQPFLNSHFDIVRISTLNADDPAYLAFASQTANSFQARKLQAAIIATPKALKQLMTRHVDVTDVVGLMHTAEGATTLYVAG